MNKWEKEMGLTAPPSIIPEDKVVWGRMGEDGKREYLVPAIILYSIIILGFLILWGYGFASAF